MSSRSHLAPTPVTDKNGKATTVYRKTGSTSGAATGIPMPQVAPNQSAKNARDNAVQALTEMGFLDYGRQMRNNCMEPNIAFLAEDSPETLAEIVAHIANASEKERSHWKLSMVMSQLYFRESEPDDMSEYARDSCLRRMAMHPIAAELAVARNRRTEEGTAVELVREAFRLTWSDPGENYSHARAMVVCLSVNPDWDEMEAPFEELPPQALEDFLFISRNIDVVEKSLHVIKERNSIDSSVIAEILKTHPAMVKGVL